jgi:bisphosphoglycerate-independent phosphoglycerate mutase (AlkP superfamily)
LHFLLIFLDGVGVGPLDPAFNPFSFAQAGIFNSTDNQLLAGGRRFLLDASLATAGLPQSATGQTAIYTGVNAARLIGKHLFGFPNQTLRHLLATDSLFIKLNAAGLSCRFINAFRPVFFTTPQLFTHLSMSATTEMNRAAGLRFSTLDHIRKGEAIYHDFSNSSLIKSGFDLPLFSARQAAQILSEQSRQYDLLLYEYFLTDIAGHAQNMTQAVQEMQKVETLIRELTLQLDFDHTILIVVSDHGNLEDLRTKSHTSNPAFMGIWTKKISGSFRTLLDITPFIINQLVEKP